MVRNSAILHALPVSTFVLGLIYYWFGVADRYAIFLYGHLGATPFDAVTRSRYWMSGLVAAGAVMVLYAVVNGLTGRAAALYQWPYVPPTWWRVWLLSAVPLTVGIPLITLSLNWPTLPPIDAASCMLVTLIGLGLALPPGGVAAQRPLDLAWLAGDGIGVMLPLLLLPAIDLPSRGIVGAPLAYGIALGSLLASSVWLGLMTLLYRWQQRPWPGARAIIVAGVCLSYLLMPLIHHVFTPPAYRYISAATNFFAFSLETQLAVWFVAALLVFWVARWRRSLPISFGNGGKEN